MSKKKSDQDFVKEVESLGRVKYIADGFTEDFDTVVEQFNGTSKTLVDFLQIWNSNNLDNLFVNRFDQRELLEFLEEAYSILTKELVSVLNTERSRQLAAIYLLMCLYIKQSDSLRLQIRMTRDNITCIRSLLEDDQIPNIDDFKYAVTKLFSSNAIKFVESSTIFGPSLLTKTNVWLTYKNRHRNRAQPPGTSAERQQNDQNIGEMVMKYIKDELNPALDEIETLKSSYNQVKERLGITTSHCLSDHFIPESINEFSPIMDKTCDDHNHAPRSDSDSRGANDDMVAVVKRIKELFFQTV